MNSSESSVPGLTIEDTNSLPRLETLIGEKLELVDTNIRKYEDLIAHEERRKAEFIAVAEFFAKTPDTTKLPPPPQLIIELVGREVMETIVKAGFIKGTNEEGLKITTTGQRLDEEKRTGKIHYLLQSPAGDVFLSEILEDMSQPYELVMQKLSDMTSEVQTKILGRFKTTTKPNK